MYVPTPTTGKIGHSKGFRKRKGKIPWNGEAAYIEKLVIPRDLGSGKEKSLGMAKQPKLPTFLIHLIINSNLSPEQLMTSLFMELPIKVTQRVLSGAVPALTRLPVPKL